MALRSSLLASLTLSLLLGASVPARPAAVNADRDGDAVYDDLEATARDAPDHRKLRVIVSLAADATRARVERLERRVETLDAKDRFSVVDAFAAVVTAGEVRKLASERGVEHVQRDSRVKAFNSSAQSAFGVTAARTALPSLDGEADGVPGAYSPGDLVAAVIDTGIDASHVDLDGGKVLAFQDFTEPSFDNALDPAVDDNGHGTHVAGTIAGDGSGGADGLGVAPRASLVGLKVLDSNGDGYTSDVIAAIDWTVANPGYGIDVINLSLGSTGCSDGTGAEAAAVNAAVAAGIVVAAAAGNEGPGRCTIGSPGATGSALTVGAIADPGAGGFYMADFSSRGRTADGRLKPDVVAPGVRIRSAAADTGSGYKTYSGTSMATPFVAGVVLLMRDYDPSLTPTQVKQKIASTALDWGRGADQTTPGSIGLDLDHGHGRLDAHAALRAIGAPLGAGATVPLHRRLSSRLAGTGSSELYTLIADSSSAPLGVTLTLADDDLNGDGRTEADSEGNHTVDFDMYLKDAAGDAVQVFNRQGSSVAAAATAWRQDAFYRPAEAPTTYTLRVESYAGGGDYLLDVSGGTIVPAGPTSAPTSSAPPAITGNPATGETLTATPGTWSPSVTPTFRWIRCDSAGTQCSETGRTGPTYTVGEGDGGKRLKVIVVAATAAGEASADSALTDAVPVTAPSLQVAPSISGEAREGSTLSVTPGSWSGTEPITRSYAWERCDGGGVNCVPTGVSSTAYVLGASDVGSTIRVVETATNDGGQANASSAPTAQVSSSSSGGSGSGTPTPEPTPDGGESEPDPPPPAAEEEPPSTTATPEPQPPAATSAPTVVGTLQEGRLLHASQGGWSGLEPITFGYQWEHCDAEGSACAPITGATSADYRLRARDVGKRLRAGVTATNSDGSGAASTEPTAAVGRSRPATLKPPRIRGSVDDGRRLISFGGTWWGSRPISFSVRWLRCDAAGGDCHRIRGADRAAYRPVEADLGHRLRIRVRAMNAAGRTRATSEPSVLVRRVADRPAAAKNRLWVRLAPHPDADARSVTVRLAGAKA